MNFQETVDFLFSMLPMYQRVGKVAYKKDLSNTLALLTALDNPHKKFKSVHIAGTNGKGTSAHALATILQLAGYKTGLYTSPHLVSFRERVKIDAVEVDEEFVIQFVDKLKDEITRINPSFFEVTVAMAFSYFAEKEVDIAVIETGLGGRLDSTNVIEPEVSLITNIGLDHTDLLGDTLLLIAAEKAGIIKRKTPVVLGEYQEEVFPVFKEKASSLEAPLVLTNRKVKSVFPEKTPYYKLANEKGIVTTAHALRKKGWKLSDQVIENGLLNFESITGLRGRFQTLQSNPTVIADVSHNREGLTILFEQVSSMKKGRIHLVFGTVKEKELEPLFNSFPKEAILYWTQSNVPRSLSADVLSAEALINGLSGTIHTNVNDAISAAKESADKDDIILVTGSTFVVAEVDDL